MDDDFEDQEVDNIDSEIVLVKLLLDFRYNDVDQISRYYNDDDIVNIFEFFIDNYNGQEWIDPQDIEYDEMFGDGDIEINNDIDIYINQIIDLFILNNPNIGNILRLLIINDQHIVDKVNYWNQCMELYRDRNEFDTLDRFYTEIKGPFLNYLFIIIKIYQRYYRTISNYIDENVYVDEQPDFNNNINIEYDIEQLNYNSDAD